MLSSFGVAWIRGDMTGFFIILCNSLRRRRMHISEAIIICVTDISFYLLSIFTCMLESLVIVIQQRQEQEFVTAGVGVDLAKGGRNVR